MKFQIIFPFSCLLIGCAQNVGAQQGKRLVPDLVLATPISVDVATDGSIIVADLTAPAVHFLGRNGRVSWSRTSKGVGPGDVMRPYRVAIGDTSVVVYDFTARDFSRFSVKGTFMQRFRLSIALTTVDDIVSIGDSLLLVLGSTRQSGIENAAIHAFSAGGAHLRSFGKLAIANDRSKLSMSGTGTLAKTDRKTVLYTRKGPFQLIEYSADGRLVRSLVPPVTINAVVDSIVRIDTNAEGRERISSRSKEIRFPVKAIPLSNNYVLSGISDRGTLRWWVHPPTGNSVTVSIPAGLSPSAWNPATCELIAIITSEDEEPALVAFDVWSASPTKRSLFERCRR